MEKEEILRDVLKYVNVKELIGELVIEKLIFTKIDELVLSSENKLDDGLAAILKPQLKQLVLDGLDAKLKELSGEQV